MLGLKEQWPDKLKDCFEDLARIEKRKKETLERYLELYFIKILDLRR